MKKALRGISATTEPLVYMYNDRRSKFQQNEIKNGTQCMAYIRTNSVCYN